MNKIAEILGTSSMPLSIPVTTNPAKKEHPTTKVGMDHTQPLPGDMSHAAPTEKRASNYALDNRYPIDDYKQIKTAAQYFENNWQDFSPAERRSYATKVASAAAGLDFEVGPALEVYSRPNFADEMHVKLGFETRHDLFAADSQERALLDKLATTTLEKTASWDTCCEALSEFDKLFGVEEKYGSAVLDPYLVFYGGPRQKVASAGVQVGDRTVTSAEILQVVKQASDKLAERYGSDFVQELKSDPAQIFGSMPEPERAEIMRIGQG